MLKWFFSLLGICSSVCKGWSWGVLRLRCEDSWMGVRNVVLRARLRVNWGEQTGRHMKKVKKPTEYLPLLIFTLLSLYLFIVFNALLVHVWQIQMVCAPTEDGHVSDVGIENGEKGSHGEEGGKLRYTWVVAEKFFMSTSCYRPVVREVLHNSTTIIPNEGPIKKPAVGWN